MSVTTMATVFPGFTSSRSRGVPMGRLIASSIALLTSGTGVTFRDSTHWTGTESGIPKGIIFFPQGIW